MLRLGKLKLVLLSGISLILFAACSNVPPAPQSRSQPSTLPAPEQPRTSSAQSNTQPPPPITLPPVTIHLAGDSTVSNYPPGLQEGWGQELAQFFNDKVTIDNQAIGGANIQTFKAGNWKKIIAGLKAGDYVLIQFGANDSGTAHGPVTPADFAAALGQMTDEVRAKGATPIFVTPSAFFQWSSNGKEDNARLAPYAAACYTAGKNKDVLVDDLNARGAEWLNEIGQPAAVPFYLRNSAGVTDKAHFQKPGATKMAELVAEELRRIKSPLAAYLKP